MKFVITKPYYNEYDVKLHWETKDKITRVLWWTAIVAGAATTAWYFGKK